jgi:hypothetical protein
MNHEMHPSCACKSTEVECVIAERDYGYLRNAKSLPGILGPFSGSLTLEVWILYIFLTLKAFSGA